MSLWWVRAVDEFLSVLHSSPFMHKQKKILNSSPHSSLESAIDQGPYVNFAEDGMVAAMGNEQTSTVVGPSSEGQNIHDESSDNEMTSDSEQDERMTTENSALAPNIAQTSKLAAKPSSIRKCLEKLSQHNRISMWLMAYIAITTSWPLVGPALQFVFKNKFKSVLPAALHGR
ncbi:hypothetical protein CK203_035663 [Vitis vinifera]|uniref:Embryogenesis-associated protein EMB8 n=1 Tax=Vitis vinifera TaxID=29760 RepID=A0A438ICM8_VITVI|nr:hypothetical protein CK203_035663 [Vitis vinifera]